ncbi:immune inhibitor A [Phycicoccus sp. MAQZ13P-2]|uniref:immune inhibitor A domain-containing protein n=1 Tax=Phycicoccus mangrovi TaxID=2840470 RepID=UPI001C004A8A|nr:immune inhibitor A domain-containing protein [Phycicoccus mangrovi]MBT9257555.1 immune inhibitor A [Phycicoccus mangrovi]MBT9275776.1 immune inhibitor A [Phycicoccus mangrovi]
MAALALTLAPTTAQAVPAGPDTPEKGTAKKVDNLPNPLAEAQAELREDAIKQLVAGTAKTTTINGNRVIEVKSKKGDANRKGRTAGKTKYVNYPVDREEDIFTVLVDFGDKVNSATGGTAGPVHNQIPKPDRKNDNSTYWLPDFNRQHYLDMMFGDGESFKDFYLKQSNGRFMAKGDVSDWVQVPYNEARYGSNKYSDATTYWPFVKDTAQAWYDDQKAQGKTDKQIKKYLAQFDKVDRYDYDGDGNFNEPDGYIDHFQAIHAGEGEEAGGGAQGEDAIWSHRWYAYSTDQGKTGPAGNKLGGVPLGDSGMWIGDYTTEPENGGLGVFTHEFGHDLGLPDLYDTAGGDNGTGFWTLMSGGSWLNHGKDSIGTTPGYMGPWEKLQLGWLDPVVVPYGQDTTVKLGSADKVTNSEAQAIIVPLPKRTVVTEKNTPHSGQGEWWSGLGNDLSSTLTKDVDLTGATSGSVEAFVSGNIEVDYDYLYGEVSADGGATWTPVGDGIDGSFDGDTDSALAWTKASWDLSDWAGKKVQFRFRMSTDGGVASEAFVDDITTKVGTMTTTDDVESGAGAWTAKGGFEIINGTTERQVQDMYFAENRTYSGYDKTLKTGPYNFGWSNTRPDWVERFPYQNGMLVWFANGEYGDNNTSAHPGGGLVLPVDARPNPVTFADGSFLGNRRQPFDATFGRERTDRVTFHKNGSASTVPSSKGIPTFDDRNPTKYWSSLNPWNSTKVAGSGTTMTVKKAKNGGRTLMVKVDFK